MTPARKPVAVLGFVRFPNRWHTTASSGDSARGLDALTLTWTYLDVDVNLNLDLDECRMRSIRICNLVPFSSSMP